MLSLDFFCNILYNLTQLNGLCTFIPVESLFDSAPSGLISGTFYFLRNFLLVENFIFSLYFFYKILYT